MCQVTIREQTTPNFVRARLRKLRNRKLREQALLNEAAALGITVQALLFKKFMACQAIRDAATVTVVRSSEPESRRSRFDNFWF